jgi:alpha-glucuronidase
MSKSMLDLFMKYDRKKLMGLSIQGYGLIPPYNSLSAMDENIAAFNKIYEEVNAVPDDKLSDFLKERFGMRNPIVRKLFIREFIPLRNYHRRSSEEFKQMKEDQKRIDRLIDEGRTEEVLKELEEENKHNP